MKSNKIRWNRGKGEQQFLSIADIREFNNILRKLQSNFQKDKEQFGPKLTDLFLKLNRNGGNKRVLMKYLKENKIDSVKFKQMIDIPNNIYKAFKK